MRTGLQGQRLVEIAPPLELAQGRDQPVGADRKGEAVAQAPAFEKEKNSMPTARQRGLRSRAGAWPSRARSSIGVVVGEDHPMALGPRGRLIDPFLLPHRGGGVVGEAQHHQFQPVPLAAGELVEIGSEALLRVQPQKLGLG
jgi:hypothetical protein